MGVVSRMCMWVESMGEVVRRYMDYLILLILTPLVSVLFAAASLLFVHFLLLTERKIALSVAYFKMYYI